MALLAYHYHVPPDEVGKMRLSQARMLINELPRLLGLDADDKQAALPEAIGGSSGGILLDELYEVVAARMAKNESKGVSNG